MFKREYICLLFKKDVLVKEVNKKQVEGLKARCPHKETIELAD